MLESTASKGTEIYRMHSMVLSNGATHLQECPPFVSFLRQMESPPFEPVADMKTLKAFLMEKMEDYALEPGNSAMDLVLFKDALLHLCRCDFLSFQFPMH